MKRESVYSVLKNAGTSMKTPLLYLMIQPLIVLIVRISLKQNVTLSGTKHNIIKVMCPARTFRRENVIAVLRNAGSNT